MSRHSNCPIMSQIQTLQTVLFIKLGKPEGKETWFPYLDDWAGIRKPHQLHLVDATTANTAISSNTNIS